MSFLPAPFDIHPRTRLVFGPGSVNRLGELVHELGCRRPLLVTDAGLVQAGHAVRAVELMQAAGLDVTLFDQVRENPTTLDVQRCLETARPAGIDCILGFGGGSSLDTAKGCNFLLTNGGEMRDYWGVGHAARPMLPLLAVPTTAGTGSECQSFALIADEETHQKMACGDPKAAPRVALLDPELTLSQPAQVTACTGIDALAHAVETAVTTRRTAYSLMHSLEAFRLVATHIRRVLADPSDLEARSAMLLGAALAGVAIESSMLGSAHSCANPLTARCNLVHGHAVGMMLPHVIRFNAAEPSAARTYAELAARLEPASERSFAAPHPAFSGAPLSGRAPTRGEEGEPWMPETPDGAERLAQFIETVLFDAGVPTRLRAAGVREPHLDSLAAEAASQWTAQFNPRTPSVSDFEELYRAAL